MGLEVQVSQPSFLSGPPPKPLQVIGANPPQKQEEEKSSGIAKQATIANPPPAQNVASKSDEAPKLGKAEVSKKQEDQMLKYM